MVTTMHVKDLALSLALCVHSVNAMLITFWFLFQSHFFPPPQILWIQFSHKISVSEGTNALSLYSCFVVPKALSDSPAKGGRLPGKSTEARVLGAARAVLAPVPRHDRPGQPPSPRSAPRLLGQSAAAPRPAAVR